MEPGQREGDEGSRRARAWLRAGWSVAEPLLALAVAGLLTLALSLPFIPLELQVEMALRPVADLEPAWSPERLASHVRAIGVAGDVRLVEDGPLRSLRLTEVTELGPAIQRVRELLARGGYEQTWFRTTPQLDMADLVREEPRLLPRFLAIQAGVFFFIGIFLARWRVSGQRVEPRSPLLRAILLGVAGGFVAIALSALTSVVLKWIGIPPHEQPWLEELLADRNLIWQLAPWVVLVIPIAEEVFFRAYVFRFMAERLGLLSGLFLSSAIFAAIHLNPSGFPLYLIVACVMAWVYQRSGSLASPIVAHMTLNGIVLLTGSLVP